MNPLRILLVDDEERFVAVTQKRLEKRGYTVVAAANAIDALDKLKTHDIHVVFLDVKMPVMDGLEALKVIKREFPLVEVIVLTGHATEAAALNGFLSGACDFLMKPADFEDLVQRAESAFKKRKRVEKKIHMTQERIKQQATRSDLPASDPCGGNGK